MRVKGAKVSDPNTFFTNPGSEIHVIYSSKVCSDGQIRLEESGKENIQDLIDSYRESTDMSFILNRLSIGDVSVLDQRQMLFGDFTDAPATLAAALQVFIDGENAFNQLPLDVRQKFDNNFRNWLFTSSQPDWMEKMQLVKSAGEVVEGEVKEDVS